MRKNSRLSYANTMYYCPGCNQNDRLFEETEEEIKGFMFWTTSKELLVNRIFCERCRFDIQREELITTTKKVTIENGVVRTEEKTTVQEGTSLLTNTKVTTSYAAYIPDVSNKSLYFDMLYLLIDYSETYQDGLNVEQDPFYQEALLHTRLNDDELSGNLEEMIIDKFKDCIRQFNKSELNSILRNSLHCLKGQLVIAPKIETMYFSLFSLMNLGELNHRSFFTSLR
jgi:hypothetical protein